MAGVATRIGRNISWLACGEALVKATLFLSAAIVGRGMGASAMGVFTVAYGAALVLVNLLAFGQQEVLIRETAITPARAGGLLASATRVQLRLGLPFAVAAGIIALSVHSLQLKWTLLSFLPYAVLRTLMVTRGASFKGRDRMGVEVAARGLEVAVAVPILSVCSFGGLPVWTTGAAFSAGGTVGLVWIGHRIRSETEPRGVPRDTGFHLIEGLPFAALGVVFQLLLRSDTFLLVALSVPHDSIGHYGAAAVPVWGLITVPQIFAVSVYPTLSRLAGSSDQARRIGLAFAGVAALVGAAFSGLLWLVREPLITLLYGPDFAPAADLLARLLWAFPGASAVMLLGTSLAANRQQQLSLALHLAGLALSLGLNVTWIPRSGAIAAATVAPIVHSATAAAMVLALLTLRRSRRTPRTGSRASRDRVDDGS